MRLVTNLLDISPKFYPTRDDAGYKFMLSFTQEFYEESTTWPWWAMFPRTEAHREEVRRHHPLTWAEGYFLLTNQGHPMWSALIRALSGSEAVEDIQIEEIHNNYGEHKWERRDTPSGKPELLS